jgi:hypothetical protein
VTPHQEKSSPKWRSSQMMKARSTTISWSERWILELVMFQYLYVAVVYVRYLLCCILVMFDVMTHLMICDIGLLYMYKVITC